MVKIEVPLIVRNFRNIVITVFDVDIDLCDIGTCKIDFGVTGNHRCRDRIQSVNDSFCTTYRIPVFMAVVSFSMFICYTVTVVVDTVTADLFSYATAGTSVIDNAVAVVIQFVTADFYISRRNADFTGKCKLL